MAAAEEAFVRLLHEDIAGIVRQLPGEGWPLCERTARAILWLTLSDPPPEAVTQSLRWLGEANQTDGFPQSEYVSIGHALVRIAREISGPQWTTTTGSAWIRFFMWLQPYLQADARRPAAHQETAPLETIPQEAARPEVPRQGAARQEAARLEAARQEAARHEAARLEAARHEAARQEAARQEGARLEAARHEAVHQEGARQEAARQEAARLEAARQEAARQEAVRQRAAASYEAARRTAADADVAAMADFFNDEDDPAPTLFDLDLHLDQDKTTPHRDE
jgi:hypothetical protein